MVQDLLNSLIEISTGDAASHSRNTLAPGDVLIREGEEASSVYVLLSGVLAVTRTVNGETALLARIDEPGAVVGEMVSMGGGIRSASVTAETEADVLGFSSERFQELLQSEPTFTRGLVTAAIQRAEEGELAELLADHFGIVDEELLMSTCSAVDWVRLSQGEVLLTEGDPSDAVYFVVRGRLQASRFDPLQSGMVELGEAGRGDVVGEMGLLGHTPRTATLTAVRDTVVAKLDEPAFFGLVDRQPRMMIQVCLNAVARAENRRQRSSSKTVVAVATSGRISAPSLVAGIEEELTRFGKVGVLSPDRVDDLLDAPGSHDARSGEIGDVRLSRLVHEVELASDHLILDLGSRAGPWTHRAVGMAERLLLVVPADMTDAEADEVQELIGEQTIDVHRTVVVVHRSGSVSPTGSAGIRRRLGADEVLHVVEGSQADLARVARVVVGRGNAVVLGGGGGRGFAHIGVMRALYELGVPIDIFGGSSIGGVFGAVAAEAWSADEMVAWAEQYFPSVLDYTIPVVSLTKGGRIAGAAEATFGTRDIEDLWRTYFSLSTNLSAARVHVHRSGPVVQALRATSAIPGVMPPVPMGTDLLVDGGVLNNLPIDVAREFTPDGLVIAVDVAPDRGLGAHADYGLSVSGFDALRARIGANKGKYPHMTAVLMNSMIAASMRERDLQASDGLADCYLDLDIKGVSMLDFHDPAAVAKQGYEVAMPILEPWWALQSGG